MRLVSARTLAFVVTLTGLVPGCASDPPVDPAELAVRLTQSLKSARVHIADGDYEQAREKVAWVLKNEPNNAEAVYCMGRVAFAEGASSKAQELLKKASDIDSENAEYAFWLGEVHKHQESYAAAATAYSKAFALDEENGEYGLAQGKMLKKSEQYADAETVLRKVIEIDKQVEYVYTELGDVLRALNKDDEALRTYMKAQTIHPGDLMAHAGAALVYEKKDDIKHALDEWSTYIRMDCCSDYSKTVARKKVETLGKSGGEADDADDEESKD